MGLDAIARRRWLGALALLAALGMVVAGSTVVHLEPAGFLIYWLVCFGFTLLAIGVAFWDASVVRRRLQQEQRELLRTTLKTIESEARKRAKATNP